MRSRAERRHHRERIRARHLRAWFDHMLDVDHRGESTFEPRRDIAERHPFACARPRCGLCHPEKRWYRGSRRQQAKREIDQEVALA